MANKHRNPTKGYFITVDETEKPKSEKEPAGDYYIAVATMVNDRIAFRKVVDDLDLNREVGYVDDHNLTPYVINTSKPYVEEVYVAKLDLKDPENSSLTPKNRHYKVMRGLRSMLPYGKDDDVFVMVDQKGGIDSNEIKRIFADIEGKRIVERNNHYCTVEPSNWFSELQVHDFYTGSVGSSINGHNDTDLNLFKELCVVRTFNKKRNQGRPSGAKSSVASTRAYPPGGHVSAPYSNYGRPLYKRVGNRGTIINSLLRKV